MNRGIINIIIVLVCASTVASGNEQDHLNYEVPKEAEVTKKYIVWGGNKGRSYFLPNVDRTDPSALVAEEVFEEGILVKRKLYFKGKLHGLQKEWYQNKRIKSEIPYKNGVIEGWCRHWSSNGTLIGKYLIKNGVGEKIIFTLDGKLQQRKLYDKRIEEGSRITLAKNGNPSGWNVYDKVSDTSIAFEFWSDGSIMRVLSELRKGAIHGVAVSYKEVGLLDELVYFVGGMQTTKDKYIAAREKDKSLIYLDDPQEYKKLFSKEMAKIYAAYKQVEPVKIPLELDQQDRPLTKSGKPFILPKLD